MRVERSNFVTLINSNPTYRFTRQIDVYPFDLPIFEEASIFQSQSLTYFTASERLQLLDQFAHPCCITLGR